MRTRSCECPFEFPLDDRPFQVAAAVSFTAAISSAFATRAAGRIGFVEGSGVSIALRGEDRS
jgi:hypothetical protein